MERPFCAITFPDGCVLTYSHPDGERFPRADLSRAEGHVDTFDDTAIAQATGRAFLEALSKSRYEPEVAEGVPA